MNRWITCSKLVITVPPCICTSYLEESRPSCQEILIKMLGIELPGLYFLLLPCHSEAVSWISGRTDVIATFFILRSLIFSSLYLFTFQYWKLILTLIFFIIALCTKESALAVPPIISILARFSCIQASPYHKVRIIKIRLLKILQLCLLCIGIVIVYFLLRYVLIGAFIGGYGTHVHVNFRPEVILSNLV